MAVITRVSRRFRSAGALAAVAAGHECPRYGSVEASTATRPHGLGVEPYLP